MTLSEKEVVKMRELLDLWKESPTCMPSQFDGSCLDCTKFIETDDGYVSCSYSPTMLDDRLLKWFLFSGCSEFDRKDGVVKIGKPIKTIEDWPFLPPGFLEESNRRIKERKEKEGKCE